MKKRFHDVDPQKRRKMLNEFCEMISKMKVKSDVEKFLRDLMTPGEIIMLLYRVEIAKMLLVGFSYPDIQKKLKVGNSTIGSVNRWLYNGFGGYMKGLKNAKDQKQRRQALPIGEWERIKRKYPIHFLIFNLLDNYKNSKK